MSILLAMVLLSQNEPQEPEFARILARLDADEPALREAASLELDRFIRRLGPRGEDFLEARIRDASAEAKARLQEKLHDLRRVEECRKSIASLDALGLPELKDKRLSLYNTGFHWSDNGRERFKYVLGWVLSETKEEVRILDLGAEVSVHPRKFDAPQGWDTLERTWPRNRPLPCEALEIDMGQAYQRVCEPERREDGDKDDPLDLLSPASGWTLHAALFVRAALHRGDERKALELLESARAAVRRDRQEERRSYPEVLTELVCNLLRQRAIACQGPRSEILKRWETIRGLQAGSSEREPDRMIALYRQMIAEDAAWKEPEQPGGAEYWIFHLRDVRANEDAEPVFSILQPWNQGKREKAYPPDELVKLGWGALPTLIDHLDDPRPTLTFGRRPTYDQSGGDVIRIGDCCGQIISAITGLALYQGQTLSTLAVKDGEAPPAKEKAQKWWAEVREAGAEAFFVSALLKPELAAHAATKLLAMNAPKHLPRLLGILENGPRESRNAILAPLAPHLGKEHRKLVLAVLGDGDPDALVTAATILWTRFRSDQGALEIILRLKPIGAEDPDSALMSRACMVLRSTRTEEVARGLALLMQSPHTQIRMDANSAAASFPHPLLAAGLVAQLGDTAQTGWVGRFEIRFCDHAAERLMEMLSFGDKFILKGSAEERDRTIGQLKSWWEKEGASVDWNGLRQKVEEAERPKPSGSK